LLRVEIRVSGPVRDSGPADRRLVLDRPAIVLGRPLRPHDRLADALRECRALRAVDVRVRIRAVRPVLVVLRALIAELRAGAAELLRPRKKQLADVRGARSLVDAAAHPSPRRDRPVDEGLISINRAYRAVLRHPPAELEVEV